MQLNNSILITGGLGYIGSSLARHLIARGHQVVIFDIKKRYVPPNPSLFVVRGDICNTDNVRRLFCTYRPNVVIHLAALKSIAAAVKHPDQFRRVNARGTENVLQVMEEYNCRNIIFASSAAVYKSQQRPMSENTPLSPINVYGITKAEGETLIKQYCHKGLQAVIFRLFNVAGNPHVPGIIDISPRTTLMKRLADYSRSIISERPALNIYGDTYPTRDGTAIRDYVYIDDVIDAFQRGLQYILSHSHGADVFNVGSGRGYTNKEIVHKFECLSDRPIMYQIRKKRPYEAVSAIASVKKAKSDLGWLPRNSNIHTIIQSLL